MSRWRRAIMVRTADCDLKLASDVTLPFCTNFGEHAHAPQVPLFDVMLPVERAAPGTDNI